MTDKRPSLQTQWKPSNPHLSVNVNLSQIPEKQKTVRTLKLLFLKSFRESICLLAVSQPIICLPHTGLFGLKLRFLCWNVEINERNSFGLEFNFEWIAILTPAVFWDVLKKLFMRFWWMNRFLNILASDFASFIVTTEHFWKQTRRAAENPFWGPTFFILVILQKLNYFKEYYCKSKHSLTIYSPVSVNDINGILLIPYLRLWFCDCEHKGFKNKEFVSQFHWENLIWVQFLLKWFAKCSVPNILQGK